jgi:hypothetical protein
MRRNAFPVRHLSQRPGRYPQAFQHKRWITRACAVSRSASFRCSLDYGATLPHRCTVAQSLMVKVGLRREPSGKGSGPCASRSHCNSGASQRLMAVPCYDEGGDGELSRRTAAIARRPRTVRHSSSGPRRHDVFHQCLLEWRQHFVTPMNEEKGNRHLESGRLDDT